MSSNHGYLRFLISLMVNVKQAAIFTLNQVFDIIIGPLFVVGSILCIMFFEPWPLKFVSMAIWLLFLYFICLLIDKVKHRK